MPTNLIYIEVLMDYQYYSSHFIILSIVNYYPSSIQYSISSILIFVSSILALFEIQLKSVRVISHLSCSSNSFKRILICFKVSAFFFNVICSFLINCCCDLSRIVKFFVVKAIYPCIIACFQCLVHVNLIFFMVYLVNFCLISGQYLILMFQFIQ